MTESGIDRRDFLKGAAATVALLIAAEGLGISDVAAAEATDKPIPGPPVKIGVIGLGQWGKEITTELAKMPSANVTAICDTYEAYVNRAAKIATNAKTFADYKQLLASPDVEAVIVATPSHLHKEIALAAIAAGKHVYCEAPLASSMDEAKAIALAGQGSKQVFQVGLQGRANPLYTHVSTFVKSGCLGDPAEVHAQSNKRQSWKRMNPNADREKELNWRLNRQTSAGLAGELGIHSLDLANWYLNAVPLSVIGFGSIAGWNDGRDVPDTVQCVLEYPNNVRMVFSSTLANSFMGDCTLFQGSASSLMMRDDRGWMIKEADSNLIGWEPYARKEQCFEETGICMLADASKILSAGGDPAKDATLKPAHTSLYSALESYTRSIRENSKPAAGALEGYQAAVTAIKANDAILAGGKIAYTPDMFELK
jgi:predicted dehydrogenase